MDINEIAALLHIVKEAGNHGVGLNYIRDDALARLHAINKELADAKNPPIDESTTEGDDDHVDRRGL